MIKWTIDLLHSQEQSDQLSNALQESNAKIKEKNELLAEKINELTTLRRITFAMTSTVDLDAVLETILEAVLGLKYECAQIYFISDDKGKLLLRLTRGEASPAAYPGSP